jgi:uncharacterized protein (TIGR01777 family)
MKILLTGSTGLIGTALAGELRRTGHIVCRLIRPDTSAESLGAEQGFDVTWNPATGELGGGAQGAEAVINLAGASIAGGRWTPARKQLLRTSRTDTTRALVAALAKMSERPRVLVSASATGYYGNRGDEVLTENSPPGTDFLSNIAKDWEAEAVKAEALGMRVVRARFGVVLSENGGALSQMRRPFQLFVGGRLGIGCQWMSWITLEDAVNILRLVLEGEHISGPINVVSPHPVSNADFTKALAATMRRPALFPAPVFALRLLLGEMADALLLSSQRVVPSQLQKLDYPFLYPDLRFALSFVLKKRTRGSPRP